MRTEKPQLVRASDSKAFSYRGIFNKAWPIILANASVPLLGLADTAVIGHFGSLTELAALAVAVLLFSFIYWALGFLRMATTGFIAHCNEDSHKTAPVFLQNTCLAVVFAVLLILLQLPLLILGIELLAPPAHVAELVGSYFYIRIWSAPAVLISYVAMGYFIGSGHSRTLLALQLLLNGVNVLLDVLFAGVFGWGLSGIALGTVLAEYLTAVVAVLVVIKRIGLEPLYLALPKLRDIRQALPLLLQNRDLFIRTLFLLLGFGFFTHIGGGFGESVLATNHLLLQYLAFVAFFLDGFAHVVEAMVGRASGRKDWPLLVLVFWRSSLLAALTGVLLALLVYFYGQNLAMLLTNKTAVLLQIDTLLPLLALYILAAVAAYQLDGLFIGACYGAAMRNCSIASFIFYVLAWYLGLHALGNAGLWWAFILFALARGISLALYLPKLKLHIQEKSYV